MVRRERRFTPWMPHMTTPSQALKSFAYATNGNSSGFLLFGSTGGWQMGLGTGMVAPGSGSFPSGDFYVRAIAVTVPSGTAGNWALIGHSGPNGDWVTPPVLVGHTEWFKYPDDAAPLFTAGEYFDCHIATNDNSISALIAFWYTTSS
jgi:hypothetical protein